MDLTQERLNAKRLTSSLIPLLVLTAVLAPMGCAETVHLAERPRWVLRPVPASTPPLILYLVDSLTKGCFEVPHLEAKLNGSPLEIQSNGRELHPQFANRGSCLAPTIYVYAQPPSSDGVDRIVVSDRTASLTASYAGLTAPRSATLLEDKPARAGTTVLLALTPAADIRTAIRDVTAWRDNDFQGLSGRLVDGHLALDLPRNLAPGVYRIEAHFDGKLKVVTCDGFKRCDDELAGFRTEFELTVAPPASL